MENNFAGRFPFSFAGELHQQLGGRDLIPEEFYKMAAVTRQAAQTGQAPP
ncbi:MAG: hypothetical protein WCD80_09130 [Desulfobaccales bacterium]